MYHELHSHRLSALVNIKSRVDDAKLDFKIMTYSLVLLISVESRRWGLKKNVRASYDADFRFEMNRPQRRQLKIRESNKRGR